MWISLWGLNPFTAYRNVRLLSSFSVVLWGVDWCSRSLLLYVFFNFYYTPLFIQVKVSLRFKSHFQEGPGIVAAKVTKHDNIATICTNMGKIRNSRSLRATFKTVTLTKRVILFILEMHLNAFTATISDNQLYDVVRTKAVLVAV